MKYYIRPPTSAPQKMLFADPETYSNGAKSGRGWWGTWLEFAASIDTRKLNLADPYRGRFYRVLFTAYSVY